MLKINRDDRQRVSFNLNGKKVHGWATTRMLLSDFIRYEIGETGTHVGCEHGVCGACTIRISGRAVRSCLSLAIQVDGMDIETIEGLTEKDGALTALQLAFRKHHALQCGFCTSGLLMSLSDLFNRKGKPSKDEITDVVGGHICRCTGYAGIIAAALEVASQR